MLRYMVSLIFLLSSANSWQNWTPKYEFPHNKAQVASPSQVKFALESKYDDTGPGAKQPEFAYHTYKNLEDAVIAYLDDPDTKLPKHEREKAINKLIQLGYDTSQHTGRQFHKLEHYKLLEKPVFKTLSIHSYFPTGAKTLDGNDVLDSYQAGKKLEPFKFQKFQAVKGNPVSLAHYTRDPDLNQAHEQFDSHPKYKFSYGVHDKTTGDSKTVHESRDGGAVRGFYSFIDADGKTRTVHYTADDHQGFKANVQKT